MPLEDFSARRLQCPVQEVVQELDEVATPELLRSSLEVPAGWAPVAMALEGNTSYGNATSVFTTNGAVARHVTENATSGMVGVNIGVPVPREPFSFGGHNDSRFGAGDITGKGGVEFWSQLKKVTTKWQLQSDANWMS